MTVPRVTLICLGAALGLTLAVPAGAADVEERLNALEHEVQSLRQQRQQDQHTIRELETRLATAESEWSDVYTEVEDVSEEAAAEANFTLTGYGAFLYFDRDSSDEMGGDNGSFQALHFNPIFQYRMGERLTWVAELELSLGSMFEDELHFDLGPPLAAEIETEFANELDLELEYTYLDYEVTDWLTFRAGKFFTPLGIFNERIHPTWINKLPTRPVPYTAPTVLLPMTDVGIAARGGVHVGDPVLTYAIALTNGPAVASGGHGGHGGGITGAFTDNNNNKAISGRLGILPYPGFEFGISGMHGAYTADGEEDYEALVLDGTIHLFANLLELRGEYIWTDQEQSGLSDDGDPLLDIDREGWWIQGAHRLAWLDNEWLMPLEFVVRYGEVDSDNRGHGGLAEDDRENFTIGLNYYILNNFIARVAYDWYDGNDTDTRADQFTAMLTYGF